MRTHTLMHTHTHTRTHTRTHTHKPTVYIHMYKSTHTQTCNNFYKYALAFLSLGALFQCTLSANLLYDCLPKFMLLRDYKFSELCITKKGNTLNGYKLFKGVYYTIITCDCLCETLHVCVFYTLSKKQL